jgi:hypothetical protein
MTLNLKEQYNPPITFISKVYFINSNKLFLIGEVKEPIPTSPTMLPRETKKVTTLAVCSNGLEAIILVARMSQIGYIIRLIFLKMVPIKLHYAH